MLLSRLKKTKKWGYEMLPLKSLSQRYGDRIMTVDESAGMVVEKFGTAGGDRTWKGGGVGST